MNIHWPNFIYNNQPYLYMIISIFTLTEINDGEIRDYLLWFSGTLFGASAIIVSWWRGIL
ncbi:MAG: hypothetical protein DRQ56_06725 [Gammaproteobacteria bacterium]|nr:MAG: hypothetical protein DRQ56_06725 [Gammaproteobacteria bacterium]